MLFLGPHSKRSLSLCRGVQSSYTLVCLSHGRSGSNSQLAKSTLKGGNLRYLPLHWAFISFQKNRIELPCIEITASSYAAPGLGAAVVQTNCVVLTPFFTNGMVWSDEGAT